MQNHCVETEIKRQYNQAVSAYFKARASNDRTELENRIDILHHALEKLDFQRLRSRHPELRGASDADVHLLADAAGRLNIQINGEDIETTY